MESVFMLAIPYEGLYQPAFVAFIILSANAFTTREEAENYWSKRYGSMEYGERIVEVKVMTSAKEESQ